MSKNKSADTGRFVTAKAAKAKPRTTFAVNDYPARMLRKLIKQAESDAESGLGMTIPMCALIANVKKRMGWN